MRVEGKKETSFFYCYMLTKYEQNSKFVYKIILSRQITITPKHIETMILQDHLVWLEAQ